jgi:hypothetical protein
MKLSLLEGYCYFSFIFVYTKIEKFIKYITFSYKYEIISVFLFKRILFSNE